MAGLAGLAAALLVSERMNSSDQTPAVQMMISLLCGVDADRREGSLYCF
jgi:hypothetical protein